MSGWLAIGLIVIALVIVALVILAFDVARGDVGGHHTMERARRILVISTDAATAAGADRWIAEQHASHPQMQFYVLNGPDDQSLYLGAHGALDRDRPDAIVIARHEGDDHTSHEGIFGRLREDAPVPVDAIYIPGEATS